MTITARFPVVLVAMLLLTMAWILPPACSSAQDETTVTAFLPAPRTLRQHLVRAKKAIEEREFGQAVAELGALLAEQPSEDALYADTTQDFFVGPFTKAAVQSSLKGEAQRILGDMPEAARELYKLQFGADAKALLDAAASTGDLEKLTEVMRKYFHTDAGYEATLLLGRLQLDRGHPLAAAMCFRRLAASPGAAKRFEPELSLLLAACWLYSDRPDQALATLADLRTRFPQQALEIGGKRIEDLPSPSEAKSWLETQLGGRHFGGQHDATQWVMYRGDPARNAGSAGDLPLPRFRWRVPTAADPTDESLIKELRLDRAEERIPAIPAVQPLAINDVILMRTPERLLAIDFQTGKRVWEYPWWDASYDDVPLTNRPSNGNDELSVRREKLYQRLWEDAPYGQVSSDGKSVFMLDELRYATEMAGNFLPRRGGIRFRNPDWPATHNQLVALDLKRQGSLRWMVGGETGLDEPKLAGAFFLGPPLALSGELYVIAEINGEIRLLAINAESGKLVWSQQLAHVDVFTVNEDPSRRLAGATPSYADGVLVCPTSAGAVVAVDVATRSLLWGYQYQEPKRRTRFGLPSPYAARRDPSRGHWIDSSVTIDDGVALLTPVESDKLLCFDLDLAGGKPRWERKRDGDLADALYVAAIYHSKAIVIAKHSVLALEMKDGQPAWASPVALDAAQGEMPSGRGFRSGNSYFLPTTTSNLVRIDLDKGSITGRMRTDVPLGNLICYKDEVIAHSATAVSSFYQIEPLRKLVAARLQESPEDPWALARQGELLLYDGKSREALAALKRAYELDPEDDGVRSLLVTTFLTSLKTDFAANRDFAEQVQPLIDLPLQQAEYWQAMAKGFHDAGDLNRAVEAYIKLTDLQGDSVIDQDSPDSLMVQQNATWSVRLDRWIQARLAQLYEEGGDVRQRLDKLVQDRAATAGSRPLAQLRRDVDHFGFHPACDAIRLVCADRLTKAGRLLEAERLLATLHRDQDDASAGAAVARLAMLYAAATEFELSARLYRELGERWPDVACYDGKTGSQLLAEAQASRSLQTDFQIAPAWPWGKVTLEQRATQSGSQSLSRLIALPVSTDDDEFAAQVSFGFDTRFNAIVARSANGRPLLQIPVERVKQNGLDQVLVDGHLGVVYFGSELVAVDMMRNAVSRNEAVQWRLSLAPRLQNWQRANPVKNPFARSATRLRGNLDVSSGRGVSSLGPFNTHGVFYERMRTLICADPLTGKPVWSQADVVQGATIFGDDDFIFVLPADGDVAAVFRAADGKPLGQRQLPAAANRWTTVGRYVLAWEAQGQRYRLYLRDVWGQSDVWSESFSENARGTLINDRAVAVLDRNGRFRIRSLSSDAVIVATKLVADNDLHAVRVVSSPEEYLVFAETHVAVDTSQTRTITAPHQLNAPIINARVYAFDRVTGASLWQIPAMIEENGLPLHQPNTSPALWFVRSISTQRTRLTPQNSNRASVLCIDRRSGRILFQKDDIATQPNEYNILVDGREATSTLILPGHSFVLKFTNDPVPPEPPAQTGAASSLSDDSNSLSDMAGSLFRTLGQQTKREPQDTPFDDGKPK